MRDFKLPESLDFRQALHERGFSLIALTSASPLTEDSPLTYFVDRLHSVGKFGDSLLRIADLIQTTHLSSSNERRHFYIINICETHYPYFYGEYDPALRRLHLPGFKAQIQAANANTVACRPGLPLAALEAMRKAQQRSILYIDENLPRLLRLFRRETFITVTADHGDCFGEDGFVGHGEVAHSKALEVPFIEGQLTNYYDS